jgi:hypothetical protein
MPTLLETAQAAIEPLEFADLELIKPFVQAKIDNYVHDPIPDPTVAAQDVELPSSTIINMSDYYPSARTVLTFRRSNSNPYMIQKMYQYGGAAYWGDDSARQLLQEKHYYTGAAKGWCLSATQPFNIWADGRVREMGGISLYGNRTQCAKNLKDAQRIGAFYVRYTKNGAIKGLRWGKQGGQSADSPFDSSFGLKIGISAAPAYNKHAWAGNQVQRIFEKFTPEFGRNESTGEWGNVNVRQYDDVIEVLFHHGTELAGAGTHDGNGTERILAGSSTFTMKIYFAKNIGMIQQEVYQAETGSLIGYSDVAPPKLAGQSTNTTYIDTLASTW